MDIKQGIFVFLLLLTFSFSAHAAQFIKVTASSHSCIKVGQVIDVSGDRYGWPFASGVCAGLKTRQGDTTIGLQVYEGDRLDATAEGSYLTVGYGVRFKGCPDGLELVDGICQEPPPNYCDRPEIIAEIQSARFQCESDGGTFSYTCSDSEQSWEPSCEKPDDGSCSAVEGERGRLRWKSSVWGESVPSSYVCSRKGGGCTASVIQDTSLCFNESGWCYGNYIVIGPACDVPPGPSFCSDPECKGFKSEPDKPPTDPDNPDHKPDDPTGGDIEDPSVLPDSDSDVVVPDKPDGKPDVEDPDIKPGTDKAVVDAVVGMNRDVNKALNDLHISINKNKADVQNEIRVLNASLVTNTQAVQKQQINDNEIYRKTKALIQQANADITTAVNRNTGAINSVGEDVGKIAGSMEGIAEDVAGISETLDGIANTDTSGAGIGGTCIQAGNCRGFYNSGYPQGLNGLVSGQLDNLKNNTIDKFVNSFGKMDLSNAKRPSFVLPVPFFGDFSFEAYINFDWIFGFVRACLIMTSIFAARRIIFGG
ncbi:hypothetical protein ACP6H7_23550 [Vibrio harveyi]|uniref:hypothetical protein n=1 Tax=Vibrio harveyi TaxID=669 RepID=UPI003CF458A4